MQSEALTDMSQHDIIGSRLCTTLLYTPSPVAAEDTSGHSGSQYEANDNANQPPRVDKRQSECNGILLIMIYLCVSCHTKLHCRLKQQSFTH